jgi:hypothetical protein
MASLAVGLGTPNQPARAIAETQPKRKRMRSRKAIGRRRKRCGGSHMKPKKKAAQAPAQAPAPSWDIGISELQKEIERLNPTKQGRALTKDEASIMCRLLNQELKAVLGTEDMVNPQNVPNATIKKVVEDTSIYHGWNKKRVASVYTEYLNNVAAGKPEASLVPDQRAALAKARKVMARSFNRCFPKQPAGPEPADGEDDERRSLRMGCAELKPHSPKR